MWCYCCKSSPHWRLNQWRQQSGNDADKAQFPSSRNVYAMHRTYREVKQNWTKMQRKLQTVDLRFLLFILNCLLFSRKRGCVKCSEVCCFKLKLSACLFVKIYSYHNTPKYTIQLYDHVICTDFLETACLCHTVPYTMLFSNYFGVYCHTKSVFFSNI